MKVLTHASEKECEEVSQAIFQRWRKDTLAQTGLPAIDCDLQGNPAAVQITVRYAEPPPPVLEIDPKTGEPMRDPQTGAVVVLVPSDPKTLLIDETVEAMQGAIEFVALESNAVYQVTGPVAVDPESGKIEAPIQIAEDGGKVAEGKIIDDVPHKQIVIDVSGALPYPVQEAEPVSGSLVTRAAVVGGSATTAGAGVAAALTFAGFGPTVVAAGGAVAAVIAGVTAFFNTGE